MTRAEYKQAELEAHMQKAEAPGSATTQKQSVQPAGDIDKEQWELSNLSKEELDKLDWRPVDIDTMLIQHKGQVLEDETGREHIQLSTKQFGTYARKRLKEQDLPEDEHKAKLKTLNKNLKEISEIVGTHSQPIIVPKDEYLETMHKLPEERPAIPSIAPPPYKYTKGICDIVVKSMFGGDKKIYSETGALIKVSNTGKNSKNMQVRARVERTDSNEPFTYEQLLVYDAVCSLYINKYDFMTDRMILNAMKHPAGVKIKEPKEEDLQFIRDTMDSFRKAFFTIEPINEKTANIYRNKNVIVDGKSLDDNLGKFDGYFLNAQIEPQEVIIGGRKVKSPYHVYSVPCLYSFADGQDHIINWTKAMKPLADERKKGGLLAGSRFGRRDMMLAYAVTQAIDEMKQSARRSKVITLEHIFNDCLKIDTKAINAVESDRIRNRLEQFLNAYKKAGVIADYKRNKKGKRIYSYTVIFEEKSSKKEKDPAEQEQPKEA